MPKIEDVLSRLDIGPLKRPLAMFNRDQSGLNPDVVFDGVEYEEPALTEVQSLELTHHSMIRDDLGSQSFDCLKLNWGNRQRYDTVLVVLLQFSVSSERPLTTHYMIEQILLQAGGQPILVFNNPGMCGSCRMTPGQRKAAKRGEFTPLAAAMLRALVFEDISKIKLVGYSLGGRLALAMATLQRKELYPYSISPTITQVVIVDNPGWHGYSRKQSQDMFAKVEGHWLSVYQSTTKDVRLRQAVAAGKTTLPQALAFLWALRGDILGSLSLVTGMRQDTANDDYRIAATVEHLKITLIMATDSDISAGWQDLLIEADHVLSTRLIRLSGDTHAFGEEGRRIAWYIVYALGLNQLPEPPAPA